LKRFKKKRVSIIGLGFVGLSIAVTNSKKGFPTIGVDIDEGKIQNLRKGITDFYEPDLKGFLDECLHVKSTEFTTNLKNSILNTDISFLCVGTPSAKNGAINLSFVKSALKNIYKVLKLKKQYHLLVIKSTVIPQTTRKDILPIFEDLINKGKLDVVSNPEFLREGYAIKDVLYPHLIVIGENNKKGGDFLEEYYKEFYDKLPEIIRTNPTTAELIKYANNLFLATKISFINSLANLCQNLPGTDVNIIAKAIGKDPRIGPLFLQAGPGFGGSCLPKDLLAIINFSQKFDNAGILFKAVDQVNKNQPKRVIFLLDKMKLLHPKKTISILGLSFKKNTDDIRMAVSISIVKDLIKKGVKIKVYDPMAMENFRQLFFKKVTYCASINECLKDSDCCLILTEWDSFRKIAPNQFSKLMKKPNIIDARRILDPTKFSNFNFHAIGLGE